MAYTINTGSNGGTYNANVNLSNGCGGSSVTFQSTVTWIHVNGKAFTVDSTTSSRTGDIKTFITPEGGTRTECPNHKITVEQEGVPCGCGSFSFTNFRTSIPQAGLGINTVIFKCLDNNGCLLDGISGTLTIGSTTYNLSIRDNGNAVLQNAVTANTATTSISATIKALYNGNVCETRNIEQEGTGCGCGSFNSFNADIPLAGLTGGSQVGTYVRTNNLCDETDLEVKLVGNGHTYNLVCSGGKMNLATSDTIHGNTGTGSIPFTLSWEYKNTPCDNKEVIQPGTGCDCGTVLMGDTFSVAIPNAGVAGGVQCGTYTKDNTSCSDSDLSATLVGGGSTYHLTFSNNKVYLNDDETIPRNGDADGIEYTVNWSFQNNPCNSFTVTQPGTGCGCGKIHNVVFNDIPSEGVGASDNFEIGTYSVDNNSCQFTFVEANNAFTMTGNNSTGKIIVTSNISENTGYTPIEYSVAAKYGNDTCTSQTISQEGTLKCDCESIGLMVTLMKSSFPKSGTTAWADEGAGQGWVLVATGDTHGCGYLSGVSESTLLEEPKLKIVELGNYQYKFFIKVKSSSSPNDESAGLKIYFRKKDEAQFDDNCFKIFYITQSYDYCHCDNLPSIQVDYHSVGGNPITINAPFEGKELAISSEDIYNSLQCYDIEVSTNANWIHINEFRKYLYSTGDYHETLKLTIDPNTGAERTGYIWIELYIDRHPFVSPSFINPQIANESPLTFHSAFVICFKFVLMCSGFISFSSSYNKISPFTKANIKCFCKVIILFSSIYLDHQHIEAISTFFNCSFNSITPNCCPLDVNIVIS